MRDDMSRSEFPDEDYSTAFQLCSARVNVPICIGVRNSGKIANLSDPDSFVYPKRSKKKKKKKTYI